MPITSKIIERNIENNKLLKESVTIAFFKLLEVKNYNDISISEICTKAGVSRTGFYRNFTSKTDIIDEFSIGLFDEIQDFVKQYIRSENRDTLEFYKNYFDKILENENMILSLKKAGFQSYHLNKSNDLLLAHQNSNDEEDKTKLIIFNGALHNVTLHWLSKENREPINVIAEWCAKYLKL